MMIGMANGLMDQNIEVGVEKKVGTITIGGVTYDRYVKIVDFGALPNNDVDYEPLGETYVGILSISGVAHSSTGNTTIPLPNNSNTNLADMVMLNMGNYIVNDSIRIITKANYSTFTALIFVEYYR